MDPATLGCLLELVRDAHRDAYMTTESDEDEWVMRDCDGCEVARAGSEQGILVMALEAASTLTPVTYGAQGHDPAIA